MGNSTFKKYGQIKLLWHSHRDLPRALDFPHSLTDMKVSCKNRQHHQSSTVKPKLPPRCLTFCKLRCTKVSQLYIFLRLPFFFVHLEPRREKYDWHESKQMHWGEIKCLAEPDRKRCIIIVTCWRGDSKSNFRLHVLKGNKHVLFLTIVVRNTETTMKQIPKVTQASLP